MALLEASPCAGVANVCTGRETSVRQLAETLAAITGQTLMLEYGPLRAGDIARSVGNPDRAVRQLGVRALVTLDDGLRRLF
jgi:UDP-glucose 4-epimerase